jgi:hypothetical protein
MVEAVHVDPDSVSSNPFVPGVLVPQPPTARHDVVEKHWILSTSADVDPTGSEGVARVQTPPDKVSNSAWVSTPPLSVYEPPATHEVIVVQEIVSNEAETAPAGAGTEVSAVHVDPDSVSISALGVLTEPNSPTATHEVMDAHQMPLRLG